MTPYHVRVFLLEARERGDCRVVALVVLGAEKDDCSNQISHASGTGESAKTSTLTGCTVNLAIVNLGRIAA